MTDMKQALEKIVAEVKETESSNTRSAGTDYRCRQFFVEHGDELLAQLAQPTGFSVTLTPTRQGFKHPDDEDKMLRLWLGETSLGQPMAMLSYGFYTEGKFEGMDYTPIDTSTLELIPLVMKDRLDAISKLTGAARIE